MFPKVGHVCYVDRVGELTRIMGPGRVISRRTREARRVERCVTLILAVSAIVAAWGVRPLGAQGLGLTSGRVLPACVDRSDTRLWVQARDIQTGEIVATSEVDENTAAYELASLPEGSYLLELVDEKGNVLCTEGPVEITADRVLYEARTIGPDVSRWWVPLLAATAAGTTTGVIVGGSSPPQPICHQGGTVTVEQDALPGHLSHGDSLGACPASPSR